MAGTITAGTLSDGSVSTSTTNCIQGSAKACVNWDLTQTVSITPRASYNVNSVTRNSAGNYTVNFTNAMPDANYVTNFSNNLTSGTNYWQSYVPSQVAAGPTVALLIANTGADRSLCMVSVFR